MRKLFLLIAMLGFAALAQSQYYYLPTTGTPEDYVFTTTVPFTMTGTTTGLADTLSAAQTIPFSFTFFGQSYTSYKISDNGYITFDMTQTKSVSANTSIPSATAPLNSIFAFWDAFTLTKPDATYRYAIYDFTYGTAPNRVHVIQWFQMHAEPAGATTTLFTFAIRLFESGSKKFDIVQNLYYNPSGTAAVTSGTIGCQNLDGTQGKMVSGSPNMTFSTTVTGTGNSDDVVYEFYQDPQPGYDLSVISTSINDLAGLNKNNAITGTIRNLGSQVVNNFKLNYSVDNGTPVVTTITQNINSGATYDFTATAWNPTTGGGLYHSIKIWADNINTSNEDNNHSNDSLSKSVFVNLGVSAKKRTVVEEFTTVQCGYCPEGHMVLDAILAAHPDVIGMCHHAGFGTDAMTITANSTIATAFADGAPTAAVDRHRFPGDAGNIAISRNLWESAAIDRLAVPAPCNVQIYGSFNTTTLAVTANVKVDFVDYALPGDIRISLFVVENHVTGTGTSWDQHSYFYNTTGHAFYHVGVYNATNGYATIAGYDHKHVVRDELSPVWGTPSIISSNVAPSQTFTKSYTTTLNAGWKKDDVTLVAIISYYNSDNNKKDIINSTEVKVTNLPANPDAIPEVNSLNSVSVYPNPVNDLGTVDFTLSSTQKVSLDIYNSFGQKVYNSDVNTFAAGNNSINFDASTLSTGTYIISLNIGGQNYYSKFIK